MNLFFQKINISVIKLIIHIFNFIIWRSITVIIDDEAETELVVDKYNGPKMIQLTKLNVNNDNGILACIKGYGNIAYFKEIWSQRCKIFLKIEKSNLKINLK